MGEAVGAEVGKAVVSGVASKVTEILFDPIQREISYVFKYQSYTEKLRSQVVDLKNKRQRLVREVREAERQGEKIFDDVQQCQVKMNELIERAEKLIGEAHDKHEKKRCFKMLSPNLMTRRKLSKEAVKAAKDATGLLAKGNFSYVSYRPSPERTEFKNVVRGYQQFDSRVKVFQEVMEALRKAKFIMIGVYGMGGVGKTTLVKEVGRQAKEEKLFDEVVMAEVTLNPDVKTIQDKIAYDLGVTFGMNETVFERAGRLLQRLKNENRILVILDNIWGKLDLEAVGIPSGVDDHKHCTILLTSRVQDVLYNDMNSQKNFAIEVLNAEEAMSFFWKTMGDHSTESSGFQPLADEIVRKCGGLPIAIKTIANALKNKALPIWQDALNQLRNSNPRQIRGMEKDVYSPIKLSYNFLASEEAKSLFRLCALKKDGSSIPINDLIMYGMGLGWFKNVYTLAEGKNRVRALIDNLKTSCLLLDDDNKHVVKMHDIIHAVAVSIAEDNLMFNIQNVDDLKEDPENALQKDATAISLPFRDIQELPDRLKCPKLKLFLLFKKHGNSLRIPDLFFEGMKELRVLRLTQICFFSLPSSLDYLIHLRTLSLINCWVRGDIARVGELKKLEFLSFRGSSIKQLPREIGQLTQLKLLDLSNCSKLKVIAPNVISKLSQLEELYMVKSFTRWEKVEGGSNASLVELKALSKLTTLDIHIPDAKIVWQDLVSVELERYEIFIGNVWEWNGWEWNFLDWNFWNNKDEISRTLKLGGLDKSIYLGHGMKKLLKRTEHLYINEPNGFQNIVPELDNGEGFPQLKYLHIKNDSKTLYIVNSVGRFCCNAFPLLESLLLHNLSNLEKVVCHSQLTEGQSFSKLRIIKVKYCHKLKHLFSFSMAKNLLRLEEIKVIDCKSLKTIVAEESENHIVHENESLNFTQLHSLILSGLPQLTSTVFNKAISWRTLSETTSASDEIIAEDDPEDLIKVLFNDKVIFSTLKKLKLYSLNIEKIWFDQSTWSCQNLTKLIVEECSRLKFLFPYSVVKSLVQLQELVIRRCESMERVIDTTWIGNIREEEQCVVFPKLKYLKLFYLPKLRTFISMSLLDSEENNILHTDTAMQPRAILDGKVGDQVKEDTIVFSQLEYLKLDSLPSLESFCSDNYNLEFPYLKKVLVRGCPSMNIFSQGSLHTPMLHKVQLVGEEEIERMEEVIEQIEGIEEEIEGIERIKEEIEGCWEGNLNSTIKKLFEQMGYGTKDAKLSQLPRWKEIWHGLGLPVSFLGNLRSLVVDDCTFRSSIAIPAHLLRFLNNLNSLEVRNCDSIEEVFHWEDSNADEQLEPLLFNLLNLKLIDLPKMKRFCNFTGNIIELPKLLSVLIENCPNMETFISNSSTPVQYMTANKEKFLLADVQPLFDEKVRLPCLKELIIKRVDKLRKIWHHQLDSGSFGKLKDLKVGWCNKLMNVFPWNIIVMERRFERLETLLVWNCDAVEEIIEAEMNLSPKCNCKEELKFPPASSSRFHMFPRLFSLKLWDLPKLKSIYGGMHDLEWPLLKELSVYGCHKVEKLFASKKDENQNLLFLVDRHKVAFPSLRNLQVSNCQELRNLLQVGEVGEDTIPIVFSELTYLKLDNLPKLKSFCLERHTLEFPYLIQVIVSECPSMQIFSQGVLRTPNLHEVQLREYTRWEGNLNSTIQKLFEEMDGFRGIIDLKLSQFPHLKEIWHGQVLPVSFFRHLGSLVLDDCTFILSAIPANLLQFLRRLKNLEVRNCDSVEEVFHLEELNVDEYFGGLLFPKLENLKLVNLPKLKRFCNSPKCPIYLRSLFRLWIENCPNMETFIPSFHEPANITANKEPQEENSVAHVQIQHLLEKMVRLPNLKVLKLSKLPKLLHLCNPKLAFRKLETLEISECSKLERLVPPSVSFQNLTTIEVSKCDGLINLVTFSTAESLANLTRMDINDCKMIEEIIQQQQVGEEVKKDCIVFSKLQSLGLSSLSSLTSFCLGNCTLEFPSLEHVRVKECPKMEIFSRGVLSTPKLRRRQVTDLDLEEEGCWEGSLN